MATSLGWKDIDKSCSVCQEQLKEPKLLPCLHLYCKDCLKSIIQGSYDVIKCPECREEIQIPTHGVDGFKTGFHSENPVESVEEVKAKNITLETLASEQDVPCHIHLEEISKQYCETCNNLPVCMTCIFGDHKGHNLHEIKTLAKVKREELSNQLEALGDIEKDKRPITLSHATEKLILNVTIEKEKVIKMYDEKDQEILTEIQDIEEKIQQLKQEKQDTEKKIFDQLQIDMEREIQAIQEKYEEIFKSKEMEMYNSFQAEDSSRKRN